MACLLLWTLFDTERAPASGDPLPLLPAEEYTIAELAKSIAAQFANREVIFDATKADGQYRKCMANGPLRAKLANFEFTPLSEGIRLTVADYEANKARYRHAAKL